VEIIGIGKDFPNRIPAAQQPRERMEKWDYIKFQSFCITKEIITSSQNIQETQK
jgi:hypothetical protein